MRRKGISEDSSFHSISRRLEKEKFSVQSGYKRNQYAAPIFEISEKIRFLKNSGKGDGLGGARSEGGKKAAMSRSENRSLTKLDKIKGVSRQEEKLSIFPTNMNAIDQDWQKFSDEVD